MKKNLLYVVVVVLALSNYSKTFAQMYYWTTPPYKFNVSLSTPTRTNLPGNPTDKYSVANGAYDQSGNLLFYVINEGIYSPTGVSVGKLGYYNLQICSESYNILQPEVSIIPVPGTCKQFYVIYAMDDLVGNCPLLYVKIDCSGSSPTVTYSQMVWNYCFGTEGHLEGEGFFIGGGSLDHTTFAVSKVVSGSGATSKRYLYSTYAFGIKRFDITSTGISNETLIASDVELGLSNSFEGYEAELSWGNNKFAWIDYRGGKIHTINLDTYYNYVQGSVKHYTIPGAKGIEFDRNLTTPYLYVTSPTGVSKINTSNQTVSLLTLPTGVDLSNTFLEYSKYGKICGVSPTYDAQGQLTATNLIGIASDGAITSVAAGFDSRNTISYLPLPNSVFTLPDQVDGENYNSFTGNALVTLYDFTLNGNVLSYVCYNNPNNFFNCNSILFNASYTGGNPSQYLLEIKAIDNNCNTISGSGYINYSSGWQNGQATENLDLRTLTDPAGLNLGNIAGKVKVTYSIQNSCGFLSYKSYNIIISSAPQANIALEIYNKNAPQVYLPASNTISAPVAVGTSTLGFRVNNSTGLITFYTVKIEEVSSTGAFIKSIYEVTKTISGVGGLTYENLNTDCVRDNVWPAPPGFGDCSNTNPAYNGFTGYFSKGDGQYSFQKYFKLTVTIGNPCNSSTEYSYLYVNSRNNKSGIISEESAINTDYFEDNLSVYPNPVTEMVTFVISNNSDDHYTLTLTDMYGREVKLLLVNQLLPAGRQTRCFNIADLPPGMYTYRLSSTSFTRKGLLSKK